MGKPERVNLIELGPGRGTLMVDLLRVCILILLCYVSRTAKTISLISLFLGTVHV